MTKPNREEMIQYILDNPDPGRHIYTREELDELDLSTLWVVWIRR